MEPDLRPQARRDDHAEHIRKRWRRRHRKLRSTAALPALFTVLNAVAGFASIHYATKDALGQTRPENLAIGGWLIFLAMVFDMLDGRLARMTRLTSDFGAQLDSLSDAISFGVAPAVLMLRTAILALSGHIERLSFMPDKRIFEQAIWCIAAIYVACSILRLARFNVENEPDEAAHMNFRGLPSPGAASVVAAMVLLFHWLTTKTTGWRANPYLLASVGTLLPVITLAVALLMVSRFKYPHVINQWIRGKRPFGYLVKLVIVAIAAMMEPYLTAAAVAIIFALLGPLGALWRPRGSSADGARPNPTQHPAA